MQRELEETKKKTEKILLERQYKRDDESRIIVNMNVKDDGNFLSMFSESDTPVISADVAEFIENSTHAIPLQEQLTLRIYSDCVDDREKVVYKKAIKEYYTERYIANEKELKRNNFIAFILFFAGVFVLALAIFLEYRISSVIWAEVIDITAWVLLWEAADILIFNNRALRLKKRRYLSYISMKIEYYSMLNG